MRHASLKQKLLACLRNRHLGGILAGPYSSTKIAIRTKERPRDVREALTALKRDGAVIWSAVDGWRITVMGLQLADMAASTLIAVAWIPASGEQIMHDRVTADIGVIDPPFTSAEMQQITYAAKMECVRILMRRAKEKRRG
jgi:hypothetical protein